MKTYEKLPVMVKAVMWEAGMEHPWAVEAEVPCNRYDCDADLEDHGLLLMAEEVVILCPGDWIVEDENGTVLGEMADDFERLYKPVEDDE